MPDERDRQLDETLTAPDAGVAELAATAPAGGRVDIDQLTAGSQLGRYVVRERIGAGGMGVVYAAHDPELERVVAIKVLRPEGAGGSTPQFARQARLLREAQALAKLTHPNVITVHDVGKVGDDVFVAMEFVDGTTLREWMKQDHSQREILDTFVQAGRGLAAAHAVDLMHRDFKPANVLIGRDGRVLVTDFGLARRPSGGTRPAASDGPPPALLTTLTQTGQLVGTPAYMSPEQHAGDEADARSDQFSYCVALYEALYGERPFPGDTITEVVEAIRAEQLRPVPKDSDVPARLRAVLLRGLSLDADDRYPSMDALLDDLGGAPRPVNWVLLGAAAVALVAGVVAAAQFVTCGGSAESEPCAAGPSHLEGVWDDARREQVRAAMLATDKRYAAKAWTAIETELDAYRADWLAMYRDACEATAVRNEQSPELLDTRMACLSQRRRELEALTAQLSSADEKLLRRANRAVTMLTPVADCGDIEALTAAIPPPRDPSTRAEVDRVRAEIGRARGLQLAGDYAEARAVLAAVEQAAHGTDYSPLVADLKLEQAELAGDMNEYEEAEAILLDAVVAASAGGHDLAEARAYVLLIDAAGYHLGKFDQGHQWARLAEAALQRAGGDPMIESELQNALGTLYLGEGKLEQSVEQYERALEQRKRLRGPDHPDVASAHHNVATALRNLGRLDEAIEHAREAVRIQTAAYGPEHPAVGKFLGHLGTVLSYNRQLDEAEKNLLEGLRIQREALGADHPGVNAMLSDLAGLYYGKQEYAKGIEMMEEVVRIQQRLPNGKPLDLANSYNNLGVLNKKLRRFDEALAWYDKALAIREERLRPDHPLIGSLHSNRGLMHYEAGAYDEARESFEKALAIYATTKDDPWTVGEATFGLARSLFKLDPRGSRARAIKLAREARKLFDSVGPRAAEDKAAVDEWLAAPE